MSRHQFPSFITGLLLTWRKRWRTVLALAVRAMVLQPCAILSG